MKKLGAHKADKNTAKGYTVRILKDIHTEELWHWIATSPRKGELLGMGQEHTEQQARQGAAECLNRCRRVVAVARQ